jgi:cytochrome c oxidase subunit 4
MPSNRSPRKWFPTLADDLFVYYVVFALLMILLLLTTLAARINLGPFNLAVALVIAAIKAGMVVLFFMHVKQASWLTWIFAGSAFLWLLIMITLTMGDYTTRESVPAAMKWQPTVMPYEQPANAAGHPFSRPDHGEHAEPRPDAAGAPPTTGPASE